MKQAELSAQMARGNLQEAINAVFRLLSATADQKFNRIPGMESVRRELTDQAVRDFKRFLVMLPEDVGLVQKAERVYRNAALVHWQTGDFRGAREAYSDAIEVLEKLPSLSHIPNPIPFDRLKLAEANRDMARFLQDNGHDREAAPYFEKALSLTDELFADFANLGPRLQKELQRITGWLAVKAGDAALEHGDLEQAGRLYRRAIELLSPVIADQREWYWYRLFVGEAHRGLGRIARERKDGSADREFAEAEQIARGVIKDQPEPDPRQRLALTLLDRWQDLPAEPGRAHEADAALDEAVALMDRIVEEFPAVTWYRVDGADVRLARAGRHTAAGRKERAEHDLAEAQRILTELMAKEPENWFYPGHLGRVEVALSLLRLRQGRGDEARRLLDEGIRHLERACQYRPNHVRDRRSLDEARQRVLGGVSTTRGGAASRP
jgi:tetratricopeptide (TPR) repeat protein